MISGAQLETSPRYRTREDRWAGCVSVIVPVYNEYYHIEEVIERIVAAAMPVVLFPASSVTGLGFNKQEYAVSRDGRFLINQPVDVSTAPPITVILNWKPKP